jgi:hypothetical protein
LGTIQETSGWVWALMDSIRLAARAAPIAPSPYLYGCTTYPLVVHEEEVHTNDYANSRSETTEKWHPTVSRSIDRGTSHVMGHIDMSQRIYNFLCSMLVYTPFALSFVTLRGVFMHFLKLTY